MRWWFLDFVFDCTEDIIFSISMFYLLCILLVLFVFQSSTVFAKFGSMERLWPSRCRVGLFDLRPIESVINWLVAILGWNFKIPKTTSKLSKLQMVCFRNRPLFDFLACGFSSSLPRTVIISKRIFYVLFYSSFWPLVFITNGSLFIFFFPTVGSSSPFRFFFGNFLGRELFFFDFPHLFPIWDVVPARNVINRKNIANINRPKRELSVIDKFQFWHNTLWTF